MKVTKKVTMYMDLPNELMNSDNWNYHARSGQFMSPCSTGFTRYMFEVDVPVTEAESIPASRLEAVQPTGNTGG